MARNDFDWNGMAIELLKSLWLEGHSISEIGRRMGTTKNSIIGKVHRLGLEPRPSPIKRDAAPKVAAAIAAVPAKPIVVSPPPKPRFIQRPGPDGTCCWPIGEPGTRSFRFCDTGADPGWSYCTEHRAIAYAPPTDWREIKLDSDGNPRRPRRQWNHWSALHV